jgi:hypothetical protein
MARVLLFVLQVLTRGGRLSFQARSKTPQGRGVFTLDTFPSCEDDALSTVGNEAGFSQHAGVAARIAPPYVLARLTTQLIHLREQFLHRTGPGV